MIRATPYTYPMSIGQRVQEMRRELGISQRELAERVSAAGCKIKQSAIGNLESGRTRSPNCIPELASVLGVTILWLRTGRGEKRLAIEHSVQNHDQVSVQKQIEDHSPSGTIPDSSIDPNITVPLRSEMPKDVPVLGTVSGGGGGFQMNGDVIDWVRRPPRLIGRADVFALYVEDTSMVPAYRPGSLIFVERSRPPAIGDDVVVEIASPEATDARRALLKRLVALTPTLVKLEQHNPARILEFKRQLVTSLLRVMTVMDLLGV